MTIRDKRLAFGATTLFIGIVCLIVWMPIGRSPAPGITVENAKRIHAAMRIEEVRGILGTGDEVDMHQSHFWENENIIIMVRFEEGFPWGVIVYPTGGGVEILPFTELEDTWTIKLLRWWRHNAW